MFSDGGDRDSRCTWGEVRALAREADACIYVLPAASRLEADELLGPRLLAELAEESGGRRIATPGGGRLREAAERLDLHWQYVLGYRPSNRERDGRWRKVEVKLAPAAADSKLRVFWRRGYVATR